MWKSVELCYCTQHTDSFLWREQYRKAVIILVDMIPRQPKRTTESDQSIKKLWSYLADPIVFSPLSRSMLQFPLQQLSDLFVYKHLLTSDIYVKELGSTLNLSSTITCKSSKAPSDLLHQRHRLA